MMRHTSWSLLLTIAVLAGCQNDGGEALNVPPPRDEVAFGPTAMRLHPVFTRVKDWTNDNSADGVEAMVEFQDAFGDPTKASGRVIFELYEYRRNQPDPRGQRTTNPWVGSLLTLQDQRDRWNRASRTYTFPLALGNIEQNQTYVLTAQYDGEDGRRFFDRLILEGRRETDGDGGGGRTAENPPKGGDGVNGVPVD